MEIRFNIEWSYGLGIGVFDVLSFTDKIEANFSKREYGGPLKRVGILLICRPTELTQRKRFAKETGNLTYDIIFDFDILKNKDIQATKGIIKEQIVKITENIVTKYRFREFDMGAFFTDLRADINSIEW